MRDCDPRRLLGLVGWVWVPLLWSVGASPACADGFRNPFQGSAAIGQGNAFAAQADDPTAVFYNPAAMTRLRGSSTPSASNLLALIPGSRVQAGRRRPTISADRSAGLRPANCFSRPTWNDRACRFSGI